MSRTTQALAEQIRTGVRPILVVVATLTAVTGLAALATRAAGLPLSTISSDPAAISNTPSGYGAISFLAQALWVSGIAAVATGLAVARPCQPGGQRVAAMLRYAAVVTAVLAVDDALLVHEEVLPGIGVPEKVVYAVYLAMVGTWAIAFRREILRGPFLLLILAAGWFALSILVDQLVDRSSLETYAEDVLKLFGIAFWSLFLFRSAVDHARAVLASPARAADSPSGSG